MRAGCVRVARTLDEPDGKEARVRVLDCENFATTLTSVAAAADVTERELLAGLRRFDPNAVDSSMDWYWAAPKAALASIGIAVDAVRFDAVCAFHGTRTLDPNGFLRDGVLPLGAMLDRLWDDLYGIAGGQVTATDWRAVRRDRVRSALA
jgi:hypothetical protein